MAKLTNCEISYERSVKVADYENKKYAARFSVLIEDGDDADEVTELYGRQIVRFVEEKLGIKSEIIIPARKSISPASPTTASPAIASPAVPDVPHIVPAAGEAPIEVKPKRSPGRPKKEEAAAKAAEPIVDDFPVEPAPAEAGPTITDAQLMEKIQNHVIKYTDQVEVRHLVQTFFPKTPNRVWASRELSQVDRPAFLQKMDAMTGTEL